MLCICLFFSSNRFFRYLFSWYFCNYLLLRLVVLSSSKRGRLLNIDGPKSL